MPQCLTGDCRFRGGNSTTLHDPVATACILQGKSLTHLQIQYALQKMLLPEQTSLEHRFPTIGRIADVIWPAQKWFSKYKSLPSPLQKSWSATEIMPKQATGLFGSYMTADSTILVSGEPKAALRFSPPHYFTNINASGKGFFYDQYAHFQFKRRIHRTKRFPVSFNELLPSTLNNFHATSPKRVSGGHFLLRVICSNKTSTGHQLPQLTGVTTSAPLFPLNPLLPFRKNDILTRTENEEMNHIAESVQNCISILPESSARTII